MDFSDIQNDLVSRSSVSSEVWVAAPFILETGRFQCYNGGMKRHFYVYILECSDGSYYVGVTNDIDRRLTEHKNGTNSTSYTFTRRPLILRYCQPFDRIREAIAWEKQVKGWSRKKKEALFNRDWNEIIRLANLKGPSTTSTGSV